MAASSYSPTLKRLKPSATSCRVFCSRSAPSSPVAPPLSRDEDDADQRTIARPLRPPRAHHISDARAPPSDLPKTCAPTIIGSWSGGRRFGSRAPSSAATPRASASTSTAPTISPSPASTSSPAPSTRGGFTDTFDVKDGHGRFLVPPPAQLFELVFSAANRGLDGTLRVEAVAADGTLLADDEVPFNTGQSQTVEVRLGRSVAMPDLGVACSPDAGETDVGCGGSACPPCAVDQKCILPSDCSTHSCVQGLCARAELSWLPVSPLPMQRSNLAAVQTSDGRLWAIGGFHTGATPGQRPDVDSYDPFTDRWTAETSLKKPRSGPSAAPLLLGGIAVAGGYVDGTGIASNSVEYYDPVAKTWTLGTHTMSQGRSAAAMVAWAGGLLITGGEQTNIPSHVSLASVDIQVAPAASTSQWAAGTAMSRGLELHAAVTLGTSVFVLGGNSTTDSNAWEAFMSGWSGTAWTDGAATLTAGRNGHAAVLAADGRIFVIGGNVSPGVVVGGVETLRSGARSLDADEGAAAPARSPGGRARPRRARVRDRWLEQRHRGRLRRRLRPDDRFAPASPSAGATVTVTGTNFAPNAPVTLTLAGAGGPLASGVADGTGNLAGVTFTAPASGTYTVEAVDSFSLYPITHPLVVN